MSDTAIFIIVLAIVGALYIYKDMVLKIAEHRAKTFVPADPIIPNEILMLIPGAYDDGKGGTILEIDGIELDFNNGEIKYHQINKIHHRDRWVNIKYSKVMRFIAEYIDATNNQPLQAVVSTTTAPQAPANNSNNVMSNKEAASHVQQNTLFTDAEQAARGLPKKYQWVFVGPNEWAIEAK